MTPLSGVLPLCQTSSGASTPLPLLWQLNPWHLLTITIAPHQLPLPEFLKLPQGCTLFQEKLSRGNHPGGNCLWEIIWEQSGKVLYYTYSMYIWCTLYCAMFNSPSVHTWSVAMFISYISTFKKKKKKILICPQLCICKRNVEPILWTLSILQYHIV